MLKFNVFNIYGKHHEQTSHNKLKSKSIIIKECRSTRLISFMYCTKKVLKKLILKFI